MRYIKLPNKKYEWHKWFAWHPVRFGMYHKMDSGEEIYHKGNLMGWLEIVHRKMRTYPPDGFEYIYAPIYKGLEEGKNNL